MGAAEPSARRISVAFNRIWSRLPSVSQIGHNRKPNTEEAELGTDSTSSLPSIRVQSPSQSSRISNRVNNSSNSNNNSSSSNNTTTTTTNNNNSNNNKNNNSSSGNNSSKSTTMSNRRVTLFAADKNSVLGNAVKHRLSNKPNNVVNPQDLIGEYTREELDEFQQVFKMFDTDGSGSIGYDELGAAMKDLGMEYTKEELNRIITEVDKDGNGEIDFEEFCDVMKLASSKKTTWNEVIKQCFTVFDRTESGFVTEKDFRYILKEVGEFEDSLIDDVFAEVDVDGNGTVDANEFSAFVRNYLRDEDIL